MPGWFKPRYPRLDWIQVEITSRCNADCRFCPHHAWRQDWQNRDMSIETFESLLPALKKTRLVYLQGWGEPFLHPDFFKLLNIGRSAGARVGTTTNGTLLDRSTTERMVTENLDFIAFSMAGMSEENDRIRKGTRLESVRKAIETLKQVKDNHGSRTPAVHIAFMLLRSRLKEIDRLPDFFAGLGVDQVVISSLSLATAPEWKKEAILADTPEEWAELTEQVLKARKTARRRNLDLHFRLVSPLAKPEPCHENILHAMVIGVNGDVSPCVMTNFPHPRPPARRVFGNINHQPLNNIWRNPAYRSFRRQWATGNLPEDCRICLKSRMVDIASETSGPTGNLVPDF